MTSLGALIVSFFRNYLVNEKGLSKATIASYSDCIRLLLSYACKHLNKTFDKFKKEDLTDKFILGFLDHLEKDRKNKVSTRNQRLGAIKTFYRFLATADVELTQTCERICTIRAKKTEHKAITPLEKSEVKEIFSVINTDTLLGARDYALFSILYNTGARVQELVDLDLSDLRTDQPLQVSLIGKGNKQRIVPLFKETVSAIVLYLDLRERGGIKNSALFLNSQGKRITRFGIRHIVNKRVEQASHNCPSLLDKNVTPHTFRHTAALHMLQDDVGLPEIKECLGHADIRTTNLYTTIDLDMKRKALDSCRPPEYSQTHESKQPMWNDPDIQSFLLGLSRRVMLC